MQKVGGRKKYLAITYPNKKNSLRVKGYLKSTPPPPHTHTHTHTHTHHLRRWMVGPSCEIFSFPNQTEFQCHFAKYRFAKYHFAIYRFSKYHFVSFRFVSQSTVSPIAQNAYCSRDINFQFKKVCRSVISCVIIHKHLERAWLIGCHECTAMLIIMMKAANQTMNGARYCFAFCFVKSNICAYFA